MSNAVVDQPGDAVLVGEVEGPNKEARCYHESNRREGSRGLFEMGLHEVRGSC